ncbi:hypothetical protein B1R32_11061 [Abditibacterium utsteinense]|uniref:Uncharacterized protein n=1 Tax=Abditibacterium utsteinense TaxID=1960156 RepID=A0A2S8SS27_9BACT|nr:hypothetical protein [Abditibacterium utsteinense]PQV63595.1 hypothetical protein B1R32_11061 [Abditibacterium utsteinense]
MQKQRAWQKERLMAWLWSGCLALWHDRTRRRALPLLLAALLLLVPSFPASADCPCELGEAAHAPAHHHEASDAHAHGEREFHSAEQDHAVTQSPVAQSPVAFSLRTAECCSCPRPPLSVVAVAVPAPSTISADYQALIYAGVHLLPAYRFDVLSGLFGRAGPPNDKPQLLFLASLVGRAPPVSF